MRASFSSRDSPRLNVRLAALAIVVAGALAYANSLRGPFVFDDFPAIRDNPTIRRLWPLSIPLSPPQDTGIGGRPLANLSFALNHALGGTEVRGYHLTNLALHLGSALLLFGIIRRTPAMIGGGRDRIATAAALWWVVHPLTTAAVSWLSQRTELLMAFLYLLTIYAFARSLVGWPGWRWVSVAACALGMLSKEVMVTAPVAVLLYDRTFSAGSFRAALMMRRCYYAALAATSLIVALLLTTTGLSLRSVGFGLGVSPWDYAITEFTAIVGYLRLAVWPTPLIFDYGAVYTTSAAVAIASAAAIVALLGFTFVGTRRRTVAGFLAALFFLLLAPTSTLVPVAEQPIAENRMYLPLAVLCIGAGVVVHRLSIRDRGQPAALVGAAGLALLTLCVARNRVYQSESRLWADTVAKRPQNPRAHFNLGVALLDRGGAAAASSEFQRAIALKPAEPKAHHSLGNALLELGRPAEALPHFAEAVRLRPAYASAWCNYGSALLRTGDAASAVEKLQRSLTLQPASREARTTLGNALFQLNRPAEAIAHYEQAIAANPDDADAHYNCGSACLELDRLDAAISHFTAAARLKPADAEIRNNLGAAFLRAGRARDAVTAFEAALRAKPDYADARDNLALARRVANESPAK